MSFSMDRILICSGCKKRVIASEFKFPEDLHDALMRLHIPHLHWLCPSCEDKFGLFSSKNNYQKQEILTKDPANHLKTIEIVLNKTEDKINFSSSSLNDFEDSEELDDINNDFGDVGTPSGLSEESSKRNKAANTIVNEILKTEVKIDKAHLLKSKDIFTTFINNCLIPFFKTDEIFSEVFQRIYYTGSSYNDLKISQANEYDVNIVLNISKQIDVMPRFFQNASLFAKLIWKGKATVSPSGLVSKFLDKFSESNVFDPLKIASWLQSLIDKFIISNPEIPDVVKVKPFQSGPARTVQLDTVYGYSICVDLVPVFQFEYSYLKHYAILNYYPVEESKQFWFLVPKPCRGEQLMFAHEANQSWRVHLPEAEKAVLYHKQCAKPVIKLLKLLRDKQDWKSYLSSYHCKTVVLWELRKNPDSKYWSEKLLYERFLEALKSLIIYYKEENLPYFFDEGYNLFHQMNAKQATNICSRLSRIVKDIEEDPEKNLKEYFKFQYISKM